jgi:hypothetical protein
LVAGIELAVGPTLPPCSPRLTAPVTALGPAAVAADVVGSGPSDLRPVQPAQDRLGDDAAWREILELRREHGGLLEDALWHEPENPALPGPAAANAAGWEEAEFGRALRQVMDGARRR